jgi:hypothetical protein
MIRVPSEGEMSALINLRPHPIVVPGIDSLDDAMRWLGAQSDGVRSVTCVDGHGRLQQHPVLDPDSYVDPTAVLIGGIVVRRGCYIGPHAVVRLTRRWALSPASSAKGRTSRMARSSTPIHPESATG